MQRKRVYACSIEPFLKLQQQLMICACHSEAGVDLKAGNVEAFQWSTRPGVGQRCKASLTSRLRCMFRRQILNCEVGMDGTTTTYNVSGLELYHDSPLGALSGVYEGSSFVVSSWMRGYCVIKQHYFAESV